MKFNVIFYSALTTIFFVGYLLTSNFWSGFLFCLFLSLGYITFLEARDYFARKHTTLENRFITMFYNGKTFDEIQKELNVTDKRMIKLITKFKANQ